MHPGKVRGRGDVQPGAYKQLQNRTNGMYAKRRCTNLPAHQAHAAWYHRGAEGLRASCLLAMHSTVEWLYVHGLPAQVHAVHPTALLGLLLVSRGKHTRRPHTAGHHTVTEALLGQPPSLLLAAAAAMLVVSAKSKGTIEPAASKQAQAHQHSIAGVGSCKNCSTAVLPTQPQQTFLAAPVPPGSATLHGRHTTHP
ncbi:hypothetical protein COO60DRAFT_1521932, partial [Scenedesmus sp. NREL 46B-D3]